MAEENCQARVIKLEPEDDAVEIRKALMGIVSLIDPDEIKDVEKALRFIEKTASDILYGRCSLENLAAIRCLAEIHRARMQRTRRAWQEATTFERIKIEAGKARERMSEFVRGEIERRNRND